MTPTVLVTGATRGIGRAVALRLAGTHHVVGLGRTRGELESLGAAITGAGGTFTGLEVDLRDAAGLALALDGVRCDVLVNNAGVMFRKPFLELTPDEWHGMVDVNLNALYHVTRAVLPGMIARGSGQVINIASIAGRTTFPGGTGYVATKHAVLGFTETLMLEVRDHGVRVSCVMPGSVATELTPGGSSVTWALRPDDVAEVVAQMVAMPAHALVYNVEVRASRPRKG
ncbi:MAG: SDR family NAD(P)-dependent oxidoreductase [Gemmatimonadaceae bacterium]|nr:SDR family NAD(P)-dependent oxidoreductase [Gemmatimonadaceae bacterium]